MKINVKYDRELTGIAAGTLLPVLVMALIWLFTPGSLSLTDYLAHLSTANIVTHIVSLSVFPNIIIFLIFNRFDMLRASRGVLAVTILWAVVVFGIKFLA
ncbi:MAG: hypothetical protein MUE32_11640 [Bacteroidales bacterium]|jgi:hypothetical protein|nr:hypothetical protein [Bacteroidales bacterium]